MKKTFTFVALVERSYCIGNRGRDSDDDTNQQSS